MPIEKLNKANKKTLREEVTQTVVMFLAVAIIAFILFTAFYMIIYQGQSSKQSFPSMQLFWEALIIFLIIYLFLLIRKIRIPLLDLMKGKKKIRYDKIYEKRETVKYSYHQNKIVDFKTQPIFNEYFIKLNDLELQVEKEDYETFKEGDDVKISLSFYSNKIIQIEKSIIIN